MNNPQESSSKLWLILVAVALAVLGIGYWYFFGRATPAAAPETVAPATATLDNGEEAGLGATVFEKVSNPVADKLPESQATVVNPLENAYKNPFQ